MKPILAAILTLALAACGNGSGDGKAKADIINGDGKIIGRATFVQGTNGVIVSIEVKGLPPGLHGMHFHNVGDCSDRKDGFKKSGGHIAPTGKPHGYLNPDGPHEGNLPNLVVGEDGVAQVELYTQLVTVSGGAAALLDKNGSALIIHENPDDHMTQPIGGSGGRIACGVIKPG